MHGAAEARQTEKSVRVIRRIRLLSLASGQIASAHSISRWHQPLRLLAVGARFVGLVRDAVMAKPEISSRQASNGRLCHSDISRGAELTGARCAHFTAHHMGQFCRAPRSCRLYEMGAPADNRADRE